MFWGGGLPRFLVPKMQFCRAMEKLDVTDMILVTFLRVHLSHKHGLVVWAGPLWLSH